MPTTQRAPMLDTKLFDNIPLELQQLNQWVVWKDDKVPYDASSPKSNLASVSDPKTWAPFDVAVSVCKRDNYSGIGFVFSDSDPYCFVDLDNPESDAVKLERQIRIFKELNSYSEISPSGLGLHVIVKAKIPNGRKRQKIEVYSSHRYATFTGNVHHNVPIAERQDVITQLWEQMGSGPATQLYGGNQEEKYTDEEIIEQASKAANGDKFRELHTGNWTEIYPSQSEADLAYIDMVGFYTQNRNQIGRIFRSSVLGKRDKARRADYLNWMINKSFDRMLPQLDFDGFKNALQDHLKNNTDNSINSSEGVLPLEGGGPIDKSSIPIPDGLLGELAQFIYSTSPRPVPEIALAAAIGLMAGICGRAYNISGTGLNQYILLIAKTGSGKEAMAYGIDKLMNSIKMQVPTSSKFLGPSEIASGQALIKYLNKFSACFVSILGEFGIRLQVMSNVHANSAEKALKRMLLDLYNKSGKGQVFRPSIFADAEKNIQSTEAPSFTILAESTPDTFYGALNEEMIADGLLPRFMLIEYEGSRPPLNENHIHVSPPFPLIERFATLTANVEMVMHAKRVIDVKSNEQAEKILKSFDKYADAQINNSQKDVIKQLWNRAHIKALKISGLLAVGVNPYDPIVTAEQVQWAINMVQSDIKTLSEKFEAGEIGHNTLEVKQGREIIKVMKEYVSTEFATIGPKYKLNQKMFDDKVIPYAYLSRRLIASAAFRHDKSGSTYAIKRAIQVLIDSDRLRQLNKQEMTGKYSSTMICYVVSNPAIFE